MYLPMGIYLYAQRMYISHMSVCMSVCMYVSIINIMLTTLDTECCVKNRIVHLALFACRGGWACVISHVTFDPYMYVYVRTRTPYRRESGLPRALVSGRVGVEKVGLPFGHFLLMAQTIGCEWATP